MRALKQSKAPTAMVEKIDYRRDEIPRHVAEIIEAHLAIEREDARSAGVLGFMARSLAIATMPHRNPKTDVFERRNGDFRLRMLAGSSAGLPYGSLPRLLVSWVCTEAVRTKSPHIQLGDSLAQFLRELQLAPGGGPRGSATRVRDQMRRLFGAMISAEYTGIMTSANGTKRSGFKLSNVNLVDDAEVWWNPQDPNDAGLWQSEVTLTPKFYTECLNGPIPIDLRAYRALSSSPLSLDIYTWLTYRMSYLTGKSRVIRWEGLQAQFGSNYSTDDQGLRNFKKAFLRELRKVQILYPEARLDFAAHGLVLLASPPHVATQGTLFPVSTERATPF